MILEEDGRVRLIPRELNVLRQSAARNGKTINTITTLDDLLAAVIDGLQPSMAADLLEFLEHRHVDERKRIAARWLIEQEGRDFSPERRTAFESWLAESEGNRQIYEALERAWRQTLLMRKPG